LLQSAPYVDISHDSRYLVEALKRLVDSNPIDVGEIYLAMLGQSFPVYEKEEIQYIVRKLFENGGEGRISANEICDIYVEKGSDILKKLWKKFN